MKKRRTGTGTRYEKEMEGRRDHDAAVAADDADAVICSV
jgi:hypothetical protein